MKKTFFVGWKFIMCLTVILFAPLSAWAQYNYYASSSFLSNQFTYPSLAPIRGSANASQKPSKVQAAARRSTANFATRANANNNPLPYNRDRVLSAKIREDFLQDFARQRTLESVEEMRETTTQNDLVQIMAGFIQLQGLDSSKMEGMIAFWYGQAWAITNQKALPTPQQYQGVADQLRASIAKSPQWNTMNEAQRQTFFEQLAYPLFVQKANYQRYLKAGKKDSMAQMASATREGLKNIGLDLQNLRLGDEGFVSP